MGPDLFLALLPSSSLNGGRGRFHPPSGSIDPSDTDLVDYEADLDTWDGSDLLQLADPWFMASVPLLGAVESAGLTGLRVGAIARLTFSNEYRRLMELGEMDRHDARDFRIVVPEHAVTILGDDEGSIAASDRITYSGWRGEDFSSSRFGPVLTERALEVVRGFAVAEPALWRIRAG